jgi:hypothetical protein
MIGTIKIGKSFRGVLNYCLEDKLEYSEADKLDMERKDGLQHKNRAEVLDYNMCYGSRKDLIKQFTDVRKLRPGLAKPVMHISLSFDLSDKTRDAILRQITREFAMGFGFDKNQYVSILHKDTRHKHLHIIANRVGFDGERVSDSQSYKRVAKICRELEDKYGMKKVLSPRKFLNEKERLLPRHDQRQEHLMELIRRNLLQADSFSDFKTRIESYQIQVIKGRGIAFQDEKKVYFKGSQLGYSMKDIENILKYPQEQRQQLQLRIDLTRRQEIKIENLSERQKESYYLKKLLQSSPGSTYASIGTSRNESTVSITRDLKSVRLLAELKRPEVQKQIIQELQVLDERKGLVKRHSNKLKI